MRKLLTVAVAATATLALAAGAIAQDPNDSEATLTATASPTTAGTANKPRNLKLGFNMKVDKPNTTVGKIEVLLPRGVKFSGKGLKKCNIEDLASIGISACPAGSKAGPKGTAEAKLGSAPLNFDVYPFVENANTFLFYLDSTTIQLQTAIRGKISNRGRKLSISIPIELRQPTGVDASLVALNQTFIGKVGRKYAVSSTKCPSGGWKFGGRLVFSARADGAPVPAPESRQSKVRCRKP